MQRGQMLQVNDEKRHLCHPQSWFRRTEYILLSSFWSTSFCLPTLCDSYKVEIFLASSLEENQVKDPFRLQNFQGTWQKMRLPSAGRCRECRWAVACLYSFWVVVNRGRVEERSWVGVLAVNFFRAGEGAPREWLLIPAAWWVSHRLEGRACLAHKFPKSTWQQIFSSQLSEHFRKQLSLNNADR